MMVEKIDNSTLLNTYGQISMPSGESNTISFDHPKDKEKVKEENVFAVNEDKEALSQDEVDEAINALQDFSRHFETHLNFSKDESTGDTIVKIIDSETDEVIRQIPSEEILRIASKMQDVIGVLFDKEY